MPTQERLGELNSFPGFSNASLAQSVEHLTVNQGVVGSSPSGGVSKTSFAFPAREVFHLPAGVRKGKTVRAYFAGGCFWCMTPIFKMYGVDRVVCGYAGGSEKAPTYAQVKSQRTGHRETILLEYDPAKVSYEKLLEIYFANVDPFDPEGQFIDRGRSYTLAIYYTSDAQKAAAAARIERLKAESGKDVCVALEPFRTFFEAEDEHQDFYLKHPEEFEKELIDSGRKKPENGS